MTKIQFELDGKQVEAVNGETIWQVAKRQGTEIPHLCYSPEPDYRPDGNCRACMVEIERRARAGGLLQAHPQRRHEVKSASPRATAATKDGDGASGSPTSRARNFPRSRFEILALGRKGRGDREPLPRAQRWDGDASHPRCASISIPASSAASACAPAARSRSTT